jgi:hypothetical protein
MMHLLPLGIAGYRALFWLRKGTTLRMALHLRS